VHAGVSTLAGRRSVLKLAHRMTLSLCRVIGGSHGLAWSRAPRAGAGDVWLTSRRNAGDPGEPQGLIAAAVLSAWLPISPTALLAFLKDEYRRPEVSCMRRAYFCCKLKTICASNHPSNCCCSGTSRCTDVLFKVA
jgi:homeobox-leucine zipper protein